MSVCRSCHRPIKWMKTVNDKNIPVDLDDYSAGETIFNSRTMTSHFSTCPNADQHRKKR